jgi:hypothetical protein
MEPHREEPQKAPPPSPGQKPKRFRIVKLEERIAPSKGGTNGKTCACGAGSYTGAFPCCSFTCAGCGSANCTGCCAGATVY